MHHHFTEEIQTMAQHKGFACPACSAEFDTREQLDGHNRKEHQHGGQAGAGEASSSSNAGTGNRGQTGQSGSPGTQR